jgi:hypothetical protein
MKYEQGFPYEIKFKLFFIHKLTEEWNTVTKPKPLDGPYYRYGTFLTQSLAPIMNAIQDDLLLSYHWGNTQDSVFVRF